MINQVADSLLGKLGLRMDIQASNASIAVAAIVCAQLAMLSFWNDLHMQGVASIFILKEDPDTASDAHLLQMSLEKKKC